MKELAPVTDLAAFEDHHIRRVFDKKTETWYFSVVDIVAALTEQTDFQKARKYWNKLKERLAQEGSQLVTNCHRLKLKAEDGKQRLTDVADAETLLRLELEETTGQNVVTGENFLAGGTGKKGVE